MNMNTTPDDTSPAATWSDFRNRWAGPHNTLLVGECTEPLAFEFPPLDRIIAELCADEQTRINCGTVGRKLELADYREHFLGLPIEKAMDEPFSMVHFKLSQFDEPGKFLHGFGSQVLDRWKSALTAAGFTFERAYPIIFISGRHSATNYHMDYSHVLAWQIHGTKKFCGLKDPDRWAPKEMRLKCKPGELEHPAELTDDDAICYTMRPGSVLWNVLLTPHWVASEDNQIAMSLNLSHGGLRLNGELSPNEAELDAYRQASPDDAPSKIQAAY